MGFRNSDERNIKFLRGIVVMTADFSRSSERINGIYYDGPAWQHLDVNLIGVVRVEVVGSDVLKLEMIATPVCLIFESYSIV